MRIGLCVIATAKYAQFLTPLLASVHKHFCPDHDVRLFIFSDQEPGDVFCGVDSWLKERLRWHLVPHRPWPAPTLYRYHTMLGAADALLGCDYVFYCDVDMRFVGRVGQEIFGDRVAVLHPGFWLLRREAFTYEFRPQSRAAVGIHEGLHYFAGGFQGGLAPQYVFAMQQMAAAIDADTARGITAVWHDESHWNRYLIDRPPDVILLPTYCTPESLLSSESKIVALDKNHQQMRS